MTRFGKDMLAASAVAIATYFTAHALVPRAEPPVDGGRIASRYLRDCSEARGAGEAPISHGEPGYRTALDRDGDGLACEHHPRR